MTRSGPAFFQHVDLARQLHGIQRVLVMDHRDCGAYTLVFGQDFARDPAAELSVHAAQMDRLRTAIAARHPDLAVELLLMALDGSVADLT